MQKNDQRKAGHKFQMPCFVADQQHGEKHGGRPAQKCQGQQRMFRDAPQVAARPALVAYGDKRRGKINNKEETSPIYISRHDCYSFLPQEGQYRLPGSTRVPQLGQNLTGGPEIRNIFSGSISEEGSFSIRRPSSFRIS